MEFQASDYDCLLIDPPTAIGGRLELRYRLTGRRSLSFTEVWSFPGRISGEADVYVRLLAFSCALSYYKTAAPGNVIVGFPITQRELAYIEALFMHGMGEFAYVNDLETALTPHIEASDILPQEIDSASSPVPADAIHALTPIGGGKDSCVSLDALQNAGVRQTLFSVGRATPIMNVIEVADLPWISAGRAIDPGLFELNRIGALNGHVPATAAISCAALIVATIVGANTVFMSNERSASEGNLLWRGHIINHQWSKGLEYENMLRDNIQGTPVDYCSLLRPYSEYRIAERFAELERYHAVFTSCSRAFTSDPNTTPSTWCGECPKCRFVAVILAPFLSGDQLLNIFGRDVLVGSLEPFLELAGVSGHKPLDCVGEVAETRLAIWEAASAEGDAAHRFLQRVAERIPISSLPDRQTVHAIKTANIAVANLRPEVAGILDRISSL